MKIDDNLFPVCEHCGKQREEDKSTSQPLCCKTASEEWEEVVKIQNEMP